MAMVCAMASPEKLVTSKQDVETDDDNTGVNAQKSLRKRKRKPLTRQESAGRIDSGFMDDVLSEEDEQAQATLSPKLEVVDEKEEEKQEPSPLKKLRRRATIATEVVEEQSSPISSKIKKRATIETQVVRETSNKIKKRALDKQVPPTKAVIPRTPLDPKDGTSFFVMSWNVDGIRAKGRSAKLVEIASKVKPDLICLQETKLQQQHEKDFVDLLSEYGYVGVFSSSTAKAGYAGTAVYYRKHTSSISKQKPSVKKMSDFFKPKTTKTTATKTTATAPTTTTATSTSTSTSTATATSTSTATTPSTSNETSIDKIVLNTTTDFGTSSNKLFLKEGRVITVEYRKFFVVNLYVLNAGQKLERLQERLNGWNVDLNTFVKTLEKRKPVIVIGDLNVAHLDNDIWNVEAKHIPKQPGCTVQEREAFTQLLSEQGGGLVDTYRQINREVKGAFTYWQTRNLSARPEGKGLRLDYALVSKVLCMPSTTPTTTPTTAAATTPIATATTITSTTATATPPPTTTATTTKTVTTTPSLTATTTTSAPPPTTSTPETIPTRTPSTTTTTPTPPPSSSTTLQSTPSVHDSWIFDEVSYRLCSDHVPIGLELRL